MKSSKAETGRINLASDSMLVPSTANEEQLVPPESQFVPPILDILRWKELP